MPTAHKDTLSAYVREDAEDHPTRRRMLNELAAATARGRTRSVDGLAIELELSPRRVRYHLSVLEVAGLIRETNRGEDIAYVAVTLAS